MRLHFLLHRPLLLLCAVFLLLSCSKNDNKLLLDKAAMIKDAINEHDTASLVDLVGTSISIREQHWEVNEDHLEPALVTKSDSKILVDKNKLKGLQLITETLLFEDSEPRAINITPKIFENELKGIEHNWQGLRVVEYSQTSDDMERRILLGFDPSTLKLLAIYSN